VGVGYLEGLSGRGRQVKKKDLPSREEMRDKQAVVYLKVFGEWGS